MSKTALLPCPYCGGQATLKRDTWPAPEVGTYRTFWTRCRKCGACCEEQQTEKLAAALWNRRSATWIRTADCLPERGQRVIICREKEPGVPYVEAARYDGGWWKVYGTNVKKITAWMPMPEPPEEV